MTIYSSSIIGAQFGDEGKGAITERMSINYDWVIRTGGGDNVGAKVYRNKIPYIHHLLPVIDYVNSQAKGYLGSGMVINMPALLEEIKTMQQDFPNVGKNTFVDIDAFIVLPEYIERDKIEGQKQGTTFRGIRQSYVAKVGREGTRVYNLINDNAEIIQQLKDVGVQFTTALQMRETFEKSKLLFEGHQGAHLGLETGRYPYITSSDTGVSSIYSSGFHWVDLDDVFGVCKPYITRSGGLKLITEMPDEEAEVYVDKGGERGNTTFRKRGIGYLDVVALRWAVERCGLTKLIFTKLDIMNGQDKIKVCVSYNGKDRVFSPSEFENVIPEYIEIDGWKDAKDPKQIKQFISFVEEKVGVDVAYISAGVEKEDLIQVKRSWL